MRPPRSPRLLKMLDALAAIFESPDTPPADRLRAIELSDKILNRRPKQKSAPKKRNQSVTSALQQIRKLQTEEQR